MWFAAGARVGEVGHDFAVRCREESDIMIGNDAGRDCVIRIGSGRSVRETAVGAFEGCFHCLGVGGLFVRGRAI